MSETAPEFQPRPPSSGPMGIDTKWWIIGGVVAAGVVYYAYKRSARNTAATASGVDPTIDPATGIPYAQESGTGTGYDPYGTSGYSPVYGTASATPVQTSTQVTVNEPLPMTNREWYTRAVTALVHHHVARAHASQVLGEYLLMVPLTTDEIRIVEEATRLVGPPPNPPRITHIPNPPHRKR